MSGRVRRQGDERSDQVGLGDDADEPAVLLADRQAPDLVPRHEPQRLFERLVGIDRCEVAGHDLADRRGLRVAALGDLVYEEPAGPARMRSGW